MIMAADLFCGAGGSSTGLVCAARARHIRLDLLAINHWNVAVDTHTRNHPWARHLCADLSTIDPNKAIPGGRLDLLIASPECTHHSNARGGKPCSDQSRASAWHVLHWAERLSPGRVLIENVREFEGWGPLGEDGRPDKSRKGETFLAFIAAMRSLGYAVEWRVLNAADFGDATCRRRLFVQATRAGKLTWPEATHAGRWRPAREIIDWDLKGESIFSRRRPLAPRTLDRIEAGLRKFGGEPFIAVLRGTKASQSGAWAKPMSAPLGTISAGGIHAALCEPFLVEYHAGKGRRDDRVRSIDAPIPTATTENRFGLCQPFVIPMEHSGRSALRSTEEPLPTITTAKGGAFALCEPFVMQVAHQGSDHTRVRSVDDPLPTIPAGHRGEIAVCEPFLTKYYGTAKAISVEIPLDTITSKDRFALVEPRGMDIRFRMLQPTELAAAMGFDGYEFAGTKTDQVRQIGNAVAVRTAEALCGAMIDAGHK
jgi:DNA (cytosine-5)-methyltransferase 1